MAREDCTPLGDDAAHCWDVGILAHSQPGKSMSLFKPETWLFQERIAPLSVMTQPIAEM